MKRNTSIMDRLSSRWSKQRDLDIQLLRQATEAMREVNYQGELSRLPMWMQVYLAREQKKGVYV